MAKTFVGALCAVVLAAPGPLLAQPMYTMGNRPVMLTADPEGLDPCVYGMIYDPPTGPDAGAIMVFPGDSTDLDAIDYLTHGDPVWICEVSDNMVGIVYTADSDVDCELSSPLDQTRPYLGPCQSGWVMPQWVEVVAG
ncbi:MAG: hypothetical protein ACK4GD_02155 [Sphingomonadaceae bacterium]